MPAATKIDCSRLAVPCQHARVFSFETDLRWMGISWSDENPSRSPWVVATSFDRPNSAAVLEAIRDATPDCLQEETTWEAAPTIIAELAARMEAFAAGHYAGDFSDVPLDLTRRTTFQRKVLQHCQQIPPGETITYGELARRAGSARAARAVGSVMSGNRLSLIVPCHRVVGGDGKLHGFSSPSGPSMKERLLAMERRQLEEAEW